MANTPLYALVYPTTASQITPLATHFANLANSVEAAMATSSSRIIGTDSARTGLGVPQLKNGLEFFTTDTKREYKYDGTSWKPNKSGLVTMFPTSVTGTLSLRQDGSIGASNAIPGRCDIDGCFTPDFNNYRIVFSMSGKQSVNPLMSAIVRVNPGADFTGSAYYNQKIALGNGSSTDLNQGAQSSFGPIFDDTGTLQFAVADVQIGQNFIQISTTFTGRGGYVTNGIKTSGAEGLPNRPSGLGLNLGQNVQNVEMRVYAYA